MLFQVASKVWHRLFEAFRILERFYCETDICGSRKTSLLREVFVKLLHFGFGRLSFLVLKADSHGHLVIPVLMLPVTLLVDASRRPMEVLVCPFPKYTHSVRVIYITANLVTPRYTEPPTHRIMDLAFLPARFPLQFASDCVADHGVWVPVIVLLNRRVWRCSFARLWWIV